MSIQLNGTSGVTTPGITDTGNLSVTGTSTLTGDSTTTGNLGVGNALSTWSSTFKTVQIGSGSFSSGAGQSQVVDGAYYNSGWKYYSSAAPSMIDLNAVTGTMSFKSAASGTAGNAITWTNQMQIDGSLGLLVQCTSAPNSTTAGLRLNTAGGQGYIASSCGTNTGLVEHWYLYNGNGLVGTVKTTGSSTQFNTSSGLS